MQILKTANLWYIYVQQLKLDMILNPIKPYF